MNEAPQRQIESILGALKGKSRFPFDESMVLATEHPEAVSDLARQVMETYPEGGTFLDAALSYLPENDWPDLVETALDILVRPGRKNVAAESVLAYASLQCLSALHPHLERIFRIEPNSGTCYEFYPWRESGARHTDFLRQIIENPRSHRDDQERAWMALFQTRDCGELQYALTHAPSGGQLPAGFRTKEEWLKANLHLAAFDCEDKVLRRLCSDTTYHLQFPDESFARLKSLGRWTAQHPSWRLRDSVQTVPMGGHADGTCALCGETLHRLILLDPIPAGLAITHSRRVEFGTCLSCLGWEHQPLFYQHDATGRPTNISYDGPAVSPQFPTGPLRLAELTLSHTPSRWFWQDWGASNSRENLHRIGGEPSWIQNSEYPTCPGCRRVMAFVFQLDSDLPMTDGGELMWGSGGIAYGFWCDECSVSAVLWQCT